MPVARFIRPAMTDIIFMVKNSSYMFVTGPDVVKAVTNEVVTAEELGGAKTHTSKSSVADAAYDNDIIVLKQVRRFFDFIPLNNTDKSPTIEAVSYTHLTLPTTPNV